LDALYINACRSKEFIDDERTIALLEEKLKYHYHDYEFYTGRKEQLKKKLELCYDTLNNGTEFVPQFDDKLFPKIKIAQILGETGPMYEFRNSKEFMKFSGISLKENRSGRKIGRTTLDKSGNAHLRGIFLDLAFKLVRKKEVYGSYYHNKRANGMPGNKAMVAVARKLGKAFYSLSQSRESIDLKRLQQCETTKLKLVV
jgi:hypothetical protein